MKNILILITALSVMTSVSACKKEEPTIPEEEVITIEEVPISDPPKYEVPKPEVPPVGEDGVWEADETALFGFAQPKQRTIVSCDNVRTCNFTTKMSHNQVKRFIEKYYPYQICNYYGATDIFEVTQDIKPEYQGDNIVPSFDRLIRKPVGDDIVTFSVVWSDRYNAYIWQYTSGYELREQRERMEAELRQLRAEDIRRTKTLLEVKNVRRLNEDDQSFFLENEELFDDNGNLNEHGTKLLQSQLDELEKQQKEDENKEGSSEPPLLHHIVL